MNIARDATANTALPTMSLRIREALAGVLIGTAVGDSLGLPMEGMSACRQQKLFRPPLRQRLVGSFGLISDDTEHTFMLAQALLEAGDDVAAFQRELARRLRWWLASLPAGVGFATLRAILKLWIGIPPVRSGVWSAGNGAAMRSALLGVYFMNREEKRHEFVHASTQITHRDPRAEIAALAVADTAAWMTEPGEDWDILLQSLAKISELSEWTVLVERIRSGLAGDQTVAGFASDLGAAGRVSGYAFHSVPVAIYAALRHREDFESAVTEALACGGDTDTVGAIAGALVAARVGVEGIPHRWRSRVIEWPCSIDLLRRVSERLGRQMERRHPLGPIPYCWPAIPVRNLLFLAVIMAHGMRRLFPPY